ncbi:MAG: hypothetical protein R6U38_06255, partial [Desulfatiglandaceae bacterium]
MMLEDLEGLLSYINDPEAEKTRYINAIQDENCLGKRSGQTRALSSRHLIALSGLDPTITIFRGFSFFWVRDREVHQLTY